MENTENIKNVENVENCENVEILENTDNRDSRDNPNNSDNQNFLKILGAALPKPPDKLIPVPASEYKTLIACRVVLETIFASMDENGYTSSGAVRAAKDVFNLYT